MPFRAPKATDKTPYTVHLRGEFFRPAFDGDFIQIASVDPATRNLALRVERRYLDDANHIETLVFEKVDVAGEVELSNTPLAGSFLCLDRFDKPGKEKSTAPNGSLVYAKVTAFLDQFRDAFAGCHMFVIERQLPDNYKSTRVAQHVLSYFMLQASFSGSPIVEVDPQLKGRQLGAPKGTRGPQLKTWSVIQARRILASRRDAGSLQAMARCRNKQDDLADTVCQIEALFSYWGLPTTPLIPEADVEGLIQELAPPPAPRRVARRKAPGSAAKIPPDGTSRPVDKKEAEDTATLSPNPAASATKTSGACTAKRAARKRPTCSDLPEITQGALRDHTPPLEVAPISAALPPSEPILPLSAQILPLEQPALTLPVAARAAKPRKPRAKKVTE